MPADTPGLELHPGEKIEGYEIQRLLGRGGMGSVYLAQHPQIGKKVAVKVLGKHVLANAEATARFLREAQVVNRIGHANLIDIFAFGQLPTGQHYLIMEYLSGEPLTNRMARGIIPWAELSELFLQLLSALQAAHDAGVVHRDLKPDNIILFDGRGRPQIKLLDFGLAKILDGQSDMTHTGIALGTPKYMAPEQSRGGRHVDHRVDIYAVGLMLYEAITGRFPFDAPTPLLMLTVKLSQEPPPPSLYAELPASLEALILRSLMRSPDDRYATANEMAAALRGVGPPTAAIDLRRRMPPHRTLQPSQPGHAPALSAAQVAAAMAQRGQIGPPLAQATGFEGEATKTALSRPEHIQELARLSDAPTPLTGEETRIASPSRPQAPLSRISAPLSRPMGFVGEATKLSGRDSKPTGTRLPVQQDTRPQSPRQNPRQIPRQVLWAAVAAVLLGVLCGILLRVGILK